MSSYSFKQLKHLKYFIIFRMIFFLNFRRVRVWKLLKHKKNDPFTFYNPTKNSTVFHQQTEDESMKRWTRVQLNNNPRVVDLVELSRHWRADSTPCDVHQTSPEEYNISCKHTCIHTKAFNNIKININIRQFRQQASHTQNKKRAIKTI